MTKDVSVVDRRFFSIKGQLAELKSMMEKELPAERVEAMRSSWNTIEQHLGIRPFEGLVAPITISTGVLELSQEYEESSECQKRAIQSKWMGFNED